MMIIGELLFEMRKRNRNVIMSERSESKNPFLLLRFPGGGADPSTPLRSAQDDIRLWNIPSV